LTTSDQQWAENFWQPVEKPAGWLAGLDLCRALLADKTQRQRFDQLVKQDFAVVVVGFGGILKCKSWNFE
jgi:hypothetical protein